MAKKIVDLNPIIKELADWCLVTKGLECRTLGIVIDRLRAAPAVDAVEVVRCKNCEHGILDEENDMYRCVRSAEFDHETGEWYGFIGHNQADYFCASGERKGKDNG